MKVEVEFMGVEEMRRRMVQLSVGVQNRVIRSALSAGLQKAKPAIKKNVPGTQKHIRRMVGASIRKQRGGPDKGKAVGKVGFGPGLRKGTWAQLVSTAKATHQQSQKRYTNDLKPGYGMSPNNIHWWLLGTGLRPHPITGNSGRMPAAPSEPAKMGVAQALPYMSLAQKKRFYERLEAEIAKLNKPQPRRRRRR